MRAAESLEICTLMGFFCQQHITFQLKSTEVLPFMTLKSDANFEEKVTFCLNNDMRNLVNFNASSGKS